MLHLRVPYIVTCSRIGIVCKYAVTYVIYDTYYHHYTLLDNNNTSACCSGTFKLRDSSAFTALIPTISAIA